MRKYNLPNTLMGRCNQDDYVRWLYRKAAALVRRDRKRDNKSAMAARYRMAIHKAVSIGGDRDAYTGRVLRWSLIGKYNNEDSKAGKRRYKKSFADLPTVDHVGDGRGRPVFKICSWRTNDCKHDLTVDELIEFCEQFLAYQKRVRHQRKR